MFLAIGKDVARAIVAPPRMMGPAPPGFSPPRDPAPAFGDSWTSDTLAELDEMCEQLGRTDTAVERMLEHTPRAIAPPPPESHEHCAARIQYLTKQVERLEKSNRALTAALEDAENVECGLAKAASDRWKHAEWYSDLETAYLHRATGPLLEYLDKCVPVGTVRRMFQLSDLALGRRAKEVQVLVAEPSGRPMRPADTQRLGAAFTKTLEEDGAWKDAPVDAAKCIDIGRMLSARPEDAIFDPKMLFQDRRIVVAVKCATYADAERGMPSPHVIVVSEEGAPLPRMDSGVTTTVIRDAQTAAAWILRCSYLCELVQGHGAEGTEVLWNLVLRDPSKDASDRLDAFFRAVWARMCTSKNE